MHTAEGHLRYPEVLAALGKFIAKKELTDVCILEIENGIVVTGDVLYQTSESYNRRTETHVFSDEDLAKLIAGGTDGQANSG